jgi:hypothetical protein
MPNTILLGHTYPNENQDPYYESQVGFFNQNDVTMWNNRLRTWMILAGGGSYTWNPVTGSLLWTSNFAIKNANSGFIVEYVYGTDGLTREAVINEGQMLYGEFGSQITANQTKNLLVADKLSNIDNIFVLAWRYGANLYFQNGVIL